MWDKKAQMTNLIQLKILKKQKVYFT